MSFLKIRDLTYSYPGGIRAIEGLNLDADRGEYIAVIGPNAAGKSTLALLLKGLLKSESGSVRIEGCERTMEGTDPRIGILFSNPENQIITSIVEEDVAFNLEISCRPPGEIALKVQSVLERLGIGHLSKRMPHLLSGGEQQMVALAGVLVLEPDILVLDEPTTFLDPDGKAAVLAAIQDLARHGKVVILITHDMSEAALADRVVLLKDGSLVADCTPMELFSRQDVLEKNGITAPFLVRLAHSLVTAGVVEEGPRTVSEAVSILGALIHGGTEEPVSADKACLSGQTRLAAIAYEHVWFKYGLPSEGGRDLLSDLELNIPEGSISMICGSNGSGKSTLLQMANGLIEPDEGRVLYKGSPLAEFRRRKGPIQSQIALLFQNPERQLFSETVFEDIAFGPRNMELGTEKVKQRVFEAMRWTGLNENLFERPVHSLSGGQMRRVAVAGVLAMDPAVLVLDEPTDSLDPEGVREFYEGVRKYCNEKGTTILMAAHSVPEEIRFFDHLSHLDNGSIGSSGRPEKVMTGPSRTLPSRYLPDHLLVQEQLSINGVAVDPVELDPVRLVERLMGMIKERPTFNV